MNTGLHKDCQQERDLTKKETQKTEPWTIFQKIALEKVLDTLEHLLPERTVEEQLNILSRIHEDRVNSRG